MSDITKIDKNFITEENDKDSETDFFDVTKAPFEIF